MRRWTILLALVVVGCGDDVELRELREQRDRICTSIESHLAMIVEGESDTRLQDLHVYARRQFGDSAINRACVGQSLPVNLDDAGMCYVARKDDACFLEPLRQLYELYRRQPWKSRP